MQCEEKKKKKVYKLHNLSWASFAGDPSPERLEKSAAVQ